MHVDETDLFYVYEIQERRVSLVNAFPPLPATLSLGKRLFNFASHIFARIFAFEGPLLGKGVFARLSCFRSVNIFSSLQTLFRYAESFSPLRATFSLGKGFFAFPRNVFTR